MQIYIDSLAHDNPIINYRYGDINRLPSMWITYYNGNRMRSSHTPFTKKNKNNRKISPLITNRLIVKSSPTLLCALESGYLFKKRELIQVLIVAHVEHISSHCVLSPLLYLGLNLRFPQMPRLEFLTDFACLGQFFNVLVEISPEYWCVPSIWSSQYHGDWQFW